MQEQPTTEQRLTILEGKFADLARELEREREIQADRDIALLARVDGSYEAIKRVERVQLRLFDETIAGQKGVEAALKDMAALFRDHKEAIETLGSRVANLEAGQSVQEAGIQQIITLLTGNTPRND